MGNNLTLMHLPAQSGKTRKMTELINKWKSIVNNDTNFGEINLIFAAKTKLLTEQTRNRVENDCDNYSASNMDEDIDDECSYHSCISSLTGMNSEESDNLGLELSPDDNTTQTVNKTLAWIHEKEKKKNIDVNELCNYIKNNTYENIICCLNSQRIKKTLSLIDKLGKEFDESRTLFNVMKDYENRNEISNPIYSSLKNMYNDKFKKRINIWIDEADDNMSIWCKLINNHIITDNCKNGFIHNIELISATQSRVYEYLSKHKIDTKLRVYKKSHADTYCRYEECEHIHTYSKYAKNKPHDYLEAILSEEYIPSNSRWFCPGGVTTISHDNMCEVLRKHGFNVLIVNGLKKQLIMDKEIVDINEPLMEQLELSVVLNSIYSDDKYNLKNKPFAVTGKLCVERGITFAGNSFMFTHGVIPNIKDADNAYQSVARCFGNIKSLPFFVTPKIYIDEETHIRILDAETHAIHTSGMFANNDIVDGNSVIIPQDILKKLGTRKPINTSSKSKRNIKSYNKEYFPLYDSVDEAKNVFKQIYGEENQSKSESESSNKYLSSAFGLFIKDENEKLIKVKSHEYNQELYIKYRGNPRMVSSYDDTIASGDLGWGVQTTARIMPVKSDNSLKYILIHKNIMNSNSET